MQKSINTEGKVLERSSDQTGGKRKMTDFQGQATGKRTSSQVSLGKNAAGAAKCGVHVVGHEISENLYGNGLPKWGVVGRRV